MTEVAFVLAPRQNHFFVELQEALRHELERSRVATSLHIGAFPAPRPGLVYALIPPHEYFALTHGRVGPPPEVFARTMFICGEQPGTPFFDWNVEYAGEAGAIFDINRMGVRAFARAGLHAEHLQLGHTALWDRFPERAGASDRDVDVLFMGAASDRRLRWLGRYANTLRHRRYRWVVSDNSQPNWAASGSFMVGEDKWALLGRSKVLLNLHQGDTPYFEWLRVVQAAANGCVVVSELSLDHEPLQPGRHFAVGRPESLAQVVELMLEDRGRWEAMQSAAYAAVRDMLPLREAGERLAAAARALESRPLPAADHAFFLQPAHAQRGATAGQARPPQDDSADRRVLKDLKLDMIDLRRRLERIRLEGVGGPIPDVVLRRRSQGWLGARPKVSVLVTLFNYRDHIEDALNSVVRSRESSWELIIVDDGSSDDSREVVDRWMARAEGAPAIFLHHPVNRGLGTARNTALAFARGTYCFVLDADNQVLPEGLPALLTALDHDREAAFAYGMLERFTESGTTGILNTYPWSVERFRETNYIDAMALLRTHQLREIGGYRRNLRLYGWEDYDLWCRMAERGWHGAFVPAVVARYRTTDHSMLSVSNISGAEARSIIAEAAPHVLGRAGS